MSDTEINREGLGDALEAIAETAPAQRYADSVARQRMAAGNCPECGNPVAAHGGWGGSGCSLTDNGAAARIAQYRADRKG